MKDEELKVYLDALVFDDGVLLTDDMSESEKEQLPDALAAIIDARQRWDELDIELQALINEKGAGLRQHVFANETELLQIFFAKNIALEQMFPSTVVDEFNDDWLDDVEVGRELWEILQDELQEVKRCAHELEKYIDYLLKLDDVPQKVLELNSQWNNVIQKGEALLVSLKEGLSNNESSSGESYKEEGIIQTKSVWARFFPCCPCPSNKREQSNDAGLSEAEQEFSYQQFDKGPN